MLYTTTPDMDGWYWIQTKERHLGDGASEVGVWMAYLDVEVGELGHKSKLFICEPEHETSGVFIEYTAGRFRHREINNLEIAPEYWIGPLNCPFGRYADSIVEPELELHEVAKHDGTAIHITYSNYQHVKKLGGTWIVARLKSVNDCEKLFDGEDVSGKEP